jgi:arabinose-5-phosphate isomerase
MSLNNKDLKTAKAVVNQEKRAVSILEKRFLSTEFNNNFSKAVELIYKCKGKVVVTGVGKSGIIAQKITATFNSTGTYAVFLHSADSIHGDLGIIRDEDVALVISRSGDTAEIRKLIPALKEFNIKIILITSNAESQLAKISDVVLDTSVTIEACPYNLTPTSSTTVSLVLGDAIAITLLNKRGFTKEEFAVFHPGGTLGKQLLLKVEDIMVKGEEIPVVSRTLNLKDVIYCISSKRLGCAIVSEKGKPVGIITDGDLRRLLEKEFDISKFKAKDIMTRNPKTVTKNTLAKTVLKIMEQNKIMQMIVTDKKKNLMGIIHMHTLVEMGL